MALNEDMVCFPNNVVNMIASALERIEPDENVDTPEFYEGVRVYKRPLATTDASRSLSVVATSWQPIMSSKEMGRTKEPILQNYFITVQCMVIDGEEERAIAIHSLMSTLVRHMLYRDPAIAIALPQIKVTFDSIGGAPMTEKVEKWDVTGQNFMNHEISASFVYLSSLEVQIQTAIY